MIKDTYFKNYEKLKDILIVSTCCDTTFMIEFYYKKISQHKLMGVEYISYKDFNSDSVMKAIMLKYNSYFYGKRDLIEI